MELYQRWLAVQDFHFYKTAVTIKSWVATLVIVLCLLGAVTFLPIHDAFQTKALWCLVVFAPAFLLGVVGAFWTEREAISLKSAATMALFGKALLVFAFGSFVSLTQNPSGKLVFAALFLFVVGFQGWAVRSSLTDVVGFVPAVVGTAGAFLLDPTGTNRDTFLLVGPFGLSMNLMLGTWARNRATLTAKVDEHRDAIRLREAELEVFRLNQILIRSWGNRHDLANVASSVMMGAELLRRQELPDRAKKSIELLHTSATRITTMLQELQEESRFERARLVSVCGRKAISEAVAMAQLRYANVTFEVDAAETPVRIVEGACAFRRLLDNLLVNACQGNGTQAARHVKVQLVEDKERVSLTVEDDGPGFPDGFLAQHKVFTTTKKDGSGLGLHMIRTIVRASGGDVVFANGKNGGAKVNVSLFKE